MFRIGVLALVALGILGYTWFAAGWIEFLMTAVMYTGIAKVCFNFWKKSFPITTVQVNGADDPVQV